MRLNTLRSTFISLAGKFIEAKSFHRKWYKPRYTETGFASRFPRFHVILRQPSTSYTEIYISDRHIPTRE